MFSVGFLVRLPSATPAGFILGFLYVLRVSFPKNQKTYVGGGREEVEAYL